MFHTLSACNRRERLVQESFFQCCTRNELHGEKRRVVDTADFKDLNNVRMLNLRQGLGFSVKAGQLLCVCQRSRANGLQRHKSIEGDVTGFVNDTHPTSSDFVGHFVARNLREFAGGVGDFVGCWWHAVTRCDLGLVNPSRRLTDRFVRCRNRLINRLDYRSDIRNHTLTCLTLTDVLVERSALCIAETGVLQRPQFVWCWTGLHRIYNGCEMTSASRTDM